MNHEQTELLLQGYVDGELDLKSMLELERHLENCEACSEDYRDLMTLHEALGAESLYHRAPARLNKTIRASIRSSSRPTVTTPRTAWLWAGLAAAGLVVAAAVVFLSLRSMLAPSSGLADEIVSSHVRSMMASHLTDVASTDQHTVKPWFDGKLDFSPDVQDLSSAGFPLVGGRLDYLDNRPVAALVYKRRLHVINLFIWPSSDANAAPQSLTRQGYHLFAWTQSGMSYWAVSDLATDELDQFVRLIQTKPTPTP